VRSDRERLLDIIEAIDPNLKARMETVLHQSPEP